MSKRSKRKPADAAGEIVEGTAGQELPGPGEEKGQVAPTPAATAATDARVREVLAKAREIEAVVVTVELPTAPVDPLAYMSDHVEGRLITPKQRRGLRLILNGGLAAPARLENGRFVQTGIDAVRYLLEQVADAAEAGD
jgi:hypothetical protein